MIVVLNKGTSSADIESFVSRIETLLHVDIIDISSDDTTMLRLLGDTEIIDESLITRERIVSRVIRLAPSYRLASRLYHPNDTVVDVHGVKVGGNHFVTIAGPCSIDNIENLEAIASGVRGVDMLRGGAFKPRTSPYAFQGIGVEGLDILAQVGKTHHMPVVSEITSTKYLDAFLENVDVIQVGARNMQNYDLLKELSKTDKTILLKRGMTSTLDELLMSAEYILAGGNPNIVLCERGVRCVQNGARATLDLTAVPVLKERTHLPVIVDPSHAAGRVALITPLARASVAVGADGIMLEVHSDPETSLSDGAQSLNIDEFNELRASLSPIARAVGREI